MKKENILSFEEQIKLTEKITKLAIRNFMDLWRKGNKKSDIEISFSPLNIIYKDKSYELGIDFCRFKPQSSHKEWENVLYVNKEKI